MSNQKFILEGFDFFSYILFYLFVGVLMDCLVFYFVGGYFTEVYKALVLHYLRDQNSCPGSSQHALVKAAVMASQRLLGCSLWVSERETCGFC